MAAPVRGPGRMRAGAVLPSMCCCGRLPPPPLPPLDCPPPPPRPHHQLLDKLRLAAAPARRHHVCRKEVLAVPRRRVEGVDTAAGLQAGRRPQGTAGAGVRMRVSGTCVHVLGCWCGVLWPQREADGADGPAQLGTGLDRHCHCQQQQGRPHGQVRAPPALDWSPPGQALHPQPQPAASPLSQPPSKPPSCCHARPVPVPLTPPRPPHGEIEATPSCTHMHPQAPPPSPAPSYYCRPAWASSRPPPPHRHRRARPPPSPPQPR